MMRSQCTIIGLITVALALFAASNASAAPAGQPCPVFTSSGMKILVATVGTGFTCTSAISWTHKLMQDHVGFSGFGNQTLHNGPTGLKCVATRTVKGIVSAGQCYKGSLAYPTSGFGWGPAP